MSLHNEALQAAIQKQEHVYQKAIDQLRGLASDTTLENDVYELTRQLGEAIFLVHCMRRLISGRSAVEIHKAFGAPGDFGYEHPIGGPLAELYRAPAERTLASASESTSKEKP